MPSRVVASAAFLDMAPLVAISVLCVLLGGAIGATRPLRERLIGPIRSFALSAVLAVLALHLVPETLETLGIAGLLVFLISVALPALLEHAPGRRGGGRLGANLVFLGLCVHQIGDGLAIWSAAGGTEPTLDLALALASHATPIAAVVFLRFEALEDRRAGYVRVLVLALVSGLGISVGRWAQAFAPEAWVPWASALASGFLCHVVAEDLSTDPPRSAVERTLDLGAAGAGIGLVMMGLAAQERVGAHAGELFHDLGRTLFHLALASSPMLLLGLAFGAAVRTLGVRVPARWIHGGGPLAQSFRGAALGIPLPLCACSVLPLARTLSARGAGASLVVAFLLSVPELGVETLALTASFMGWPFALFRVVAAIALPACAALVVAWVSGSRSQAGRTELAEDLRGSFPERFVHGFDDLLHHIGPWITAGILAAGYVAVVVPKGVFEGTSSALEVLVVSVLALPSYVCASSATPLGAVLLEKGLSPGAVLAGLILGPATNLATFSFVAGAYGRRAAWAGAATMLVAAFALAFVLDVAAPRGLLPVTGTALHDPPSLTAWAAALVLTLALVRSVWRTGFRGWIASLGSTKDVHAHVHAVAPPEET